MAGRASCRLLECFTRSPVPQTLDREHIQYNLTHNTTALAVTFPVTWDVPSNGLQMQSFSTARCGDTVVIKCPPGVRNGVFRITNRELC
jgi:hypothetical protein